MALTWKKLAYTDDIPVKAAYTDINTGTDDSKFVTSDGFAASNFGIRLIYCKVFDDATALTIGDGKVVIPVPTELHGMNIVGVRADVTTVSSSGDITVNIRRIRVGTGSGTNDILSTALTIDASEKSSLTATTAAVISATYDDLSANATTYDHLAIDVDGAGTGAKGLAVMISCQLP